MKHNKIKNPAILFNILIKQMILENTSQKGDRFAISLVKKYFNKKTELGKEYLLYKSFIENKDINKLDELYNFNISQYKKLDENRLKTEKYNLLREMFSKYNKSIFENKIDNYKIYAEIQKNFRMENESFLLFEQRENEKQKLINLIKETFFNKTAFKSNFANEKDDVKVLAIKLFGKKYRQKYESILNNKQKSLINAYINNDPKQFKNYFVNESLNAVIELSKHISKKDISIINKAKMNVVIENLKNYNKLKVLKESNVKQLMLVYDIIDKLNEI